jgi:hypothetical protein
MRRFGLRSVRAADIGFQDLSESGESMLFRNVRIAELK